MTLTKAQTKKQINNKMKKELAAFEQHAMNHDGLLGGLHSRWQNECNHESFVDYELAIAKAMNNDKYTFTRSKQKPMTFAFSCDWCECEVIITADGFRCRLENWRKYVNAQMEKAVDAAVQN